MSGHQPWYVLRTLPQREIHTEKLIRRIGYEAMAPYEEGRRRVHRTPRSWKYPLFPGYVFASWPNWNEGWNVITAKNTGIAWVYDFLRPHWMSPEPSILKSADVEHLKSIADGKFKREDGAPSLVVGDRVLVPDGLLQGHTSTIVSIKRGKKATIEVSEGKNAIYLDRPLADLVKA